MIYCEKKLKNALKSIIIKIFKNKKQHSDACPKDPSNKNKYKNVCQMVWSVFKILMRIYSEKNEKVP